MKIFNKSGRAFKFLTFSLQPQTFTTIPDEHAELAKKALLDAYPKDLVTDEEAGKDTLALTQNLGAKEARIKELEAVNKRLQDLLVRVDDEPGPTKADMDAALARIDELESLLESRDDTIRTLESVATPAPVEEKAPAQQPQQAAKGGGKKARHENLG